MKLRKTRLAAAIAAALCSGVVLAQQPAVAQDTQRDANQQKRIEQGMQSGQINNHEASKLEGEEKHVDKMEAHDMKDGHMSAGEQQRLDSAQNKVSRDIAKDKHNGATGDPDSKTSRRMEADVQRDANQEQRISNGERSSQLSGRQVGKLERGQAHDDAKQSAADANGHITRDEQNSINRSDNRQSDHVHDDRGGY